MTERESKHPTGAPPASDASTPEPVDLSSAEGSGIAPPDPFSREALADALREDGLVLAPVTPPVGRPSQADSLAAEGLALVDPFDSRPPSNVLTDFLGVEDDALVIPRLEPEDERALMDHSWEQLLTPGKIVDAAPLPFENAPVDSEYQDAPTLRDQLSPDDDPPADVATLSDQVVDPATDPYIFPSRPAALTEGPPLFAPQVTDLIDRPNRRPGGGPWSWLIALSIGALLGVIGYGGYWFLPAVQGTSSEMRLVEKGTALLRQGDAAEAIPLFEMAIASRPDLAIAHRRLGIALMSAGEIARARQTLTTYLELTEDVDDATRVRAYLDDQMQAR